MDSSLKKIRIHLLKWGGVGTVRQIVKGTGLSEKTVRHILKKHGEIVSKQKGWKATMWALKKPPEKRISTQKRYPQKQYTLTGWSSEKYE